ncbi:MAG: PIN domain-containing protein [Armatimonadetes bacterium]|nr:PIN domain-containing protein [Armatimonadota bacterium]
MIFLDTSAIYAMADRADPHHELALERFLALIDAGEDILTHNYILVESLALLQSRLGRPAALKFARDARAFIVEWVDQRTHDEAVRHLARSGDHRVSLVDQVSFVIMQRHGVATALAFDLDIEKAGFRLFTGRW